jgi:excisionase family DNA binding protein
MSTNPLLTCSSPVIAPLALRPREAAAMMGISVSSLTRLTKAGEIPCIKNGNKVFYRVATLDAWLARRESGGNDSGMG